ncbi:MAG: YkgJ family cysteine cluster protein [Nitrospiraceae bacterium]|nr:YkgJ family cysteine cluster protein [Nitrospiraceae bacterium]
MKNIKKAIKKSARERLRFPEDEARLPWLPILLEAYSVIDAGVLHATDELEKRQNKKLACRKGCGHCCRSHTDIPFYPLELTGIYWFCMEKMEQAAREELKEKIRGRCGAGAAPRREEGCIFLHLSSSQPGGACSIHQLRPAACRQFNVFGRPCAPGEDPFFTRRGDVLTPVREYMDRALFVMMPFYGIHGEAQREKAVREGFFLRTQAMNLQKQNWTELLRLMEGFDASKK